MTYRMTEVQAYATSEKFFNELSGALDGKIPDNMKLFVDPGETKKIVENPIITIWFGYPIGNGSIEIPIKYDAAMFRSLREGDGVVAHILSNLPVILGEFRYLADDIRASANALIGTVNTLLMMPPEEEQVMCDEPSFSSDDYLHYFMDRVIEGLGVPGVVMGVTSEEDK